jgi:hypothetical protein
MGNAAAVKVYNPTVTHTQKLPGVFRDLGGNVYAIEQQLTASKQFASKVLHAVADLQYVDLTQLSDLDIILLHEWLQSLWALLHRSEAVQEALRAAEFRELTHVSDVARHTMDALSGRAFGSWAHGGLVYEETVPLMASLVRLQQLGFLTTQSQPTECVVEVEKIGDARPKRFERHQRAFVEGLLREHDMRAIVNHVSAMPSKVGYHFVTTTGEQFMSGTKLARNRLRYLNEAGEPVSEWLSETIPHKPCARTGRYLNFEFDSDTVASEISSLAALNPALAKKVAQEYTAFGFVFALKACTGDDPVDLLKVVINALEAQDGVKVTPNTHVLTVYEPLKTVRPRIKTEIVARNLADLDLPSSRARIEYVTMEDEQRRQQARKWGYMFVPEPEW